MIENKNLKKIEIICASDVASLDKHGLIGGCLNLNDESVRVSGVKFGNENGLYNCLRIKEEFENTNKKLYAIVTRIPEVKGIVSHPYGNYHIVTHEYLN